MKKVFWGFKVNNKLFQTKQKGPLTYFKLTLHLKRIIHDSHYPEAFEWPKHFFWRSLPSLYHKLWFSNSYIFAVQCYRHLTFQTMTSVRSNNISLKYQRFTTKGSKDLEIRKSEFVARTQLLCIIGSSVNVNFKCT